MRIKDQFARDKGAWCGLSCPQLFEGPAEDKGCKEEIAAAAAADAVIFGIAYDGGVSYRGGAAQGPAVLRENTFCSTPYTENFASFENLKVYDGGDFYMTGQDRDAFFKEIEDYVCELTKRGIFFTMVGGDHSVTIPVQRGIDRAVCGDFGIIHIDAHFDLCDTLGGDPLSHGSTERRALELEHISGPENLYFAGIRSIEPDEYTFKKANPIQVISASQFHKMGTEAAADAMIGKMKQFSAIYITLDIDCLDPAFAAGTGTPQFGGLYSRQVLDLMAALFDNLPVIGMDVVEISPALDPSLTSMFAGRKIIQEAWGRLAAKLGKLEE